jgi:hypothetical protein
MHEPPPAAGHPAATGSPHRLTALTVGLQTAQVDELEPIESVAAWPAARLAGDAYGYAELPPGWPFRRRFLAWLVTRISGRLAAGRCDRLPARRWPARRAGRPPSAHPPPQTVQLLLGSFINFVAFIVVSSWLPGSSSAWSIWPSSLHIVANAWFRCPRLHRRLPTASATFENRFDVGNVPSSASATRWRDGR